jgi:tetratricopeptide (TPR) repeat protein
LIVRSRNWIAPARFTLLEPIREHTRESLREAGRDDVVRARHLEQTVSKVRTLAAEHVHSQEAHQAVIQFAAMRGDVSAALDYAIAEGRAYEGVELAADSTSFWRLFWIREGIAWMDRLRPLDVDQSHRLRLLRSHRALLSMAGRFDEALSLSEEILASGAANLNDRQGYAALLSDAGDARGAIPLLERVEAEARETRDAPMVWQAIAYLSQSYLTIGQIDRALEYADAMEAAIVEFGISSLRLAYVRMFQAAPYVAAGQAPRAAQLLRELLEIGSSTETATYPTSEGLLLVADLAVSRNDAARGWAIAAAARAFGDQEGFGYPSTDGAALPGQRIRVAVDQPAELTLSEAVQQANAVLDEILGEAG